LINSSTLSQWFLLRNTTSFANICKLKRFPFNAANILKENSKLVLNHLFEGEENQLKKIRNKNFELLLNFFAKDEEEINEVLAGYVCKVFDSLLDFHYHSILDYFMKN